MTKVTTESELTCPACGFSETLSMPTNACQWFHECNHCHALLKPNRGDCCVFCSFGSIPCPPIQITGKQNGGCCEKSIASVSGKTGLKQ